jgi:hypothetical protein
VLFSRFSPDEQLLFDSDDEPEYLSDVVDSAMRQYETIDDEELDRNLLAAGLPILIENESEKANQEQLEKLYKILDDDEKKKFTQTAEGLFEKDLSVYTNCFRKKI